MRYYLDLTLIEFLDVISGFDETYPELTGVEIYNYLNKITGNFNPEQTQKALKDIDVYYHMEFLERINDESIKLFAKNGWEIPYKACPKPELNDNMTEKQKAFITNFPDKLPDYEKMIKKTHPYTGYSLYEAIKILKNKVKEPKKEQIKGFQSKLTDEQITSLYNKMQGNYFDTSPENFKSIFRDEPIQTHIDWNKSSVLLAYFIKKLFYIDNPFDYWNKAKFIFNAKNLRQSESNNPYPKGHTDIDNILNNLNL
jgi:hypothetical protein